MEIDRRIIYLLVALSLALPLYFDYSVKPARLKSAEKLFNAVDQLSLKEGEIAFVAIDWGANTIAENGPQTEVVIEHLMRKRIPFALFSTYAYAEPILNSLPEKVAKRLMIEQEGERWQYGIDWVNFGYRPGVAILLQAVAKSDNLLKLFKEDAYGTPLTEIKMLKNFKTLENIRFLAQLTGLLGTFDAYIQFFQKKGYRPIFGHGCTSITIPEAYIYLDSKQIVGLLEGIAGAAWYSEMLKEKYPDRAVDDALVINTGLGIAHLMIILLLVVGNISSFRRGAK